MRYLIIVLLAAIAVAALPSFAANPQAPTLKPGDIPPRYVGRLFDGTDVEMDLASGKAHVVTFWASWCGPCRQELPILSNLQRKVGADRMRVIAVNIEERSVYRKLRRMVTDLGLTAAYDPNARAQKSFGVRAIPYMLIVGRDGKVVSVRTGYAQAKLDDYVADFNLALAEPANHAEVESSE